MTVNSVRDVDADEDMIVGVNCDAICAYVSAEQYANATGAIKYTDVRLTQKQVVPMTEN